MVKMYKGFNKDMTCNGFQYEEGKEYTCNEARLCECGFHACEMPLDCFKYYKPDKSVYHEVELDDVDERKSNDSKRCGKKIKIGAKLEIADIVNAQIEFTREHADNAGGNCSTNAGGDSSTNAGGYGSLLVIGHRHFDEGKLIIDGYAHGIVDGGKIKADTWYKYQDGELVEVAENE